MSGPSAAERPTASRRYWIIVTALVIAELTCALESNMLTVALAQLYGQYGDPVRVTWLITAYALTSASSAAICSRLGDIYGRRRMLLIMLLCAAVGSFISAFGPNLGVIILGRALQGASLAVLPLAFGILREAAPDKRRLDLGVGVLGGTFSFSTGLGIVLGGIIVDRAPWQNIFLVSGSVALVALVFGFFVLPKGKTRPAIGRLDLIGGVAFVFPIAALLLGLNLGRTQGWDSASAWGLVLGGVAGLVAWTLYELKIPNPMIDVRLLRKPQIAIVNAVIALAAMGPMIYPNVLMPLLQQPVWTGVGLGISATLAGLVKLPTNLTSGVGAIYSGYLAQKFTFRPVVVAATAVNLVAWVLLTINHGSVWLLVIAAVLMIAPAQTILFGCAPSLIMEVTPEDRTSEATGLSSVLRAVAMAVGSQFIAFALASSSITNAAGESYPDEHSYLVTFIVVTGFAFASFLAALMIPRPGRKPALVTAPEPA